MCYFKYNNWRRIQQSLPAHTYNLSGTIDGTTAQVPTIADSAGCTELNLNENTGYFVSFVIRRSSQFDWVMSDEMLIIHSTKHKINHKMKYIEN